MIKKPQSALSRRTFVKGTAAAGAAAAVGPWVISSKALGAGELNVLMWSDYLPEGWISSFEAATGIKLNYTGIGSNEEIINQMKASKGAGFDICSPTNNRSGQWGDLELLQPWDYGKISNIDMANPSMLKVGDTEWNFGGKGSHWLPHIWGTEGIGWRTDLFTPKDGVPSYGDVWDPANAGKTMMRVHSGMLGAGLHMEASGQMDPGSVWAAYKDEDTMRKVWDQILAFTVKNKPNLKLTWNDADTQKNGLLNDGVIVGQTWDGPPLALKTAGEPVTYQAPKEGSMAWVDGMSLSAAAENLDQAYEFVTYCYEAEPAGIAIDSHGYNSAVLGADAFSGDNYKKNFSEAYPGEALANLNPWPAEPQWYADVRTEYENKFQAA
ncbi:MAG: extracellular solute-binding protein [Arenicellales bacterium]